MEDFMLGEALLRDVALWLSPADLRRARLVCKSWRSALGTLSTRASTPPEASTVTKWKVQLESMVQALPCLHHLTIGSKISAVGAQQLVVLAEAKQLRALHIPHGQALQDRSLQALAPLAATLQELRIRGAASLSSRCLLVLSVLGHLEVLELKNCGKVSWHELHKAWQLACLAYEAQAAEGSSGPGSGAGSGTSGSSVYSRIGGLFKIPSPSSSTIQSAMAKQQQQQQQQQQQRLGGGLLSMVQGKGLLGGAVGNGRCSTGGSSHEGAVRKLLYRKLKIGAVMTAAATAAGREGKIPAVNAAPEEAAMGVAAEVQFKCETVDEGPEEPAASQLTNDEECAAGAADGIVSSDSLDGGIMQDDCHSTAAVAAAAPTDAGATAQPPPQHHRSSGSGHTSALYRVGSLMWQGTTAAAAALSLSSGSSITRQSSAVQAALLAYVNEADGALPVAANSSGNGSANSSAGGSSTTDSGSSSSSSKARKLLPRRQCSSDGRPLPAMPFTKLTILSFTCSEVTFKNPGPELAAVAALTTLTHLEMSKCKLPDPVFWHLTRLTRLSKLKLSGLWSMGDAGLEHVAKMTSLRSLALSEAMHVTAAGLMALSQLTAVTSLALGLTQDLGSGSIARAVNGLPQLHCLEVTASCWDDVDCQLLAAADAATAAAAHCFGNSVSSLCTAQTLVNGSAVHPVQQQHQVPVQAPLMLWQLPVMAGGSLSRSNSSKIGGLLSASSSRSNSSMNLRASSRAGSFSSMNSFGSFSSVQNSMSTADMVRMPAAPGAASRQRLLVLKLHGCRMMTHRGLEALRKLPELHTLVIDNCKEVHAAEALSQDLLPPNLASLSLRNTVFGNVFNGCVSMPACAMSLTKLELASQSAAHVGQMRRVLSFFPQLLELSIAGCVDLGEQLMCHLPLLPRLQQLTLSGTRVTGEAFDQLVHLRELHVLRCRGCNLLTDAGLGLLALVPSLQELDVTECGGLSERGLLAVMLNTASLVKLDVSGCKGVSRELVQCCPHYLHLVHSL